MYTGVYKVAYGEGDDEVDFIAICTEESVQFLKDELTMLAPLKFVTWGVKIEDFPVEEIHTRIEHKPYNVFKMSVDPVESQDYEVGKAAIYNIIIISNNEDVVSDVKESLNEAAFFLEWVVKEEEYPTANIALRILEINDVSPVSIVELKRMTDKIHPRG